MNRTVVQLACLRATPSWWFAGFTAGAALQLQQTVLWPLQAYQFLAMAALLLALLFKNWPKDGQRLAVTALMAAMAFGFGTVGWRAVHFAANAMSPALEGVDIQITGRVLAMPQRSDEAVRFRLAVESAQFGVQSVLLPDQLLLGWYSGFGGGFGGRSPPANDSIADTDEAALALQRQPQNLRPGER